MYPTISYLIKDLTGWWIPLPLQTFGVLLALSFWAGAVALKSELKRKEHESLISFYINRKGEIVYPHQDVGTIVFLAAIWGIIGARVFSILEYFQDFLDDPIGTLLSMSGLTFYGGLVFAAIAILYYTRKRGVKTVYMLDAAAPALMLSYAIGRIGCQLAGDGDWGIDNLFPKPNWLGFLPNWAWAYNYPHNVIREGIPIAGCVDKYCAVLQYPVFPTPLYEVIMCSFLFLILWVIRKQITTPGMLFCIYLIMNGTERFLIEQIRIDSEYHFFGMAVKQAELISALLVLTGISGMFYVRYSIRKN
ncbi:MAG: prolipoprotein diacylglyceryl transferase family protein [Bacteroidota bacterium]